VCVLTCTGTDYIHVYRVNPPGKCVVCCLCDYSCVCVDVQPPVQMELDPDNEDMVEQPPHGQASPLVKRRYVCVYVCVYICIYIHVYIHIHP